MSVLQVYLSWVNSIVSEVDGTASHGVASIQQGRTLCQLIDILCYDARLLQKVETSTDITAQAYLRVALDHMRNHGIKFHFTPQDILDGDIKSILDVLWLLILNYSIHSIASSPYQRSVGIGKKILLDWCQRELQLHFDSQHSLTYNLCSGDSFLKLLTKHSGLPAPDITEKEDTLKTLLASIQDRFGIRQEIISASDIIDGTVDDHTLMIYISLLKLKVGDNDEAPLTPPTDLSFQSTERPPFEETGRTEVPAITLSQVEDDGQPGGAEVVSASESSTIGSPEPTETQKRCLDGTDHDTSDWASVSSGSPVSISPISGSHDTNMEHKVPAHANSFINDTISQHIEEHIGPADSAQKGHASRIPVRVKSGDDSEPTHESVADEHNTGLTRFIAVKVQRPRSPQSIMAEQRLKQEAEKEKKRKEKEVLERQRKEREESERKLVEMESEGRGESGREGQVLTGSEGGEEAGPRRMKKMPDLGSPDPVKSDDDDQEKAMAMKNLGPEFFTKFEQLSGGVGRSVGGGMPMFVMPGQKHDMDVLLEALHHARTEASAQDQRIHTTAQHDQAHLRKTVDKNIEHLEAQLKAVKAQSMELFAESKADHDMTELKTARRAARDGSPVSEGRRGGHGERRSPPRGIRDVMANHDIHSDEPIVQESLERDESPERTVPHGILRHRSPVGYVGRPESPMDGGREATRSPSRYRPGSPPQRELRPDQLDDDKRLIKFLSKEIENMKLKMAIMEKNQERSHSPYGHGPRVSSGLPQRDRSPNEICSRARARLTDIDSDASLSSYSPTRRARSVELLDQRERSRSRSRSPRLGQRSPMRSPANSPIRSPVRSRTPDTFSRERIRPFSPSARVLSLQDLSTSVYDNPEGKVTFSPASGAKSVDLGYSSPIHKVTQEIWGYDQTEDEYYQDVAKYEKWKKLISRDAVTDEDMLELKQALASALVELDILQAKLNNANTDIKDKMGKTTEILNDCRAHLGKAQAENVELRGQAERERSRAAALDMRLRDLEATVHSSRANQDDTTHELEQSVVTLKGIVGLDKTQMASLEDENNKLRMKLTDMQRENIKLKEDFNELKMYNDKAQTTVKDLKSCLEDARTERTQLSTEIQKMRDQGNKNQVSNIMHHYMEKGLYEPPEKSDRQRSRSRPMSPVRSQSRPISPTRSRSTSPRRYRARSVSPVLSRTMTPVRSTSPGDNKLPTYSTSGYTGRSQTPVDQSYNYEDISPTASDSHEIYPHRRTRSYVQKFGSQNDGRDSPVDLSDPELLDLMNAKSKLNYDVDLTDNTQYGLKKDRPEHFNIEENTAELSAKRRLMYSPYMDKDMLKSKSTQIHAKDNATAESEKKTYKPASHEKPVMNEELANRKFILALDSAVKENPAQLAQQRMLNDLDDADQWRPSSARGILKTKKSAQNVSIKNTPLRRSYESRSYSPSIRTPLPRSFSPAAAIATKSSSPSRPYIANRSYKPTEARTTHVSLQTKPRSHSPGNAGSRSYSPTRQTSPDRHVGRCYSPEQRYRTGNPGNSGRRDSGYSTPTKPANRAGDYSHPTTAQSTVPRITPRLTKLEDELHDLEAFQNEYQQYSAVH